MYIFKDTFGPSKLIIQNKLAIMSMRKSLLLVLLQILLFSVAFAQKKEITGKVVDASNGEPLAGVSILADQNTSPALTNNEGIYRISVDAKASTLVFSFVGYGTQTVAIAGKSVIDVRLAPAITSMDEVIVIGYGTQKKSHLTGSISQLKTDKLDESPVSRVDQALQGKIAGVQIQNLTSEAGSEPKIRVRGISSINAGASPLVVVDGHPVPDGLAFVNMADVASVEVLKDAASAAIYGSRGASGVIIITTKSGKADRPKYNVKVSTGLKTAYETYPMMSMSEYANLLYYEAALRAKDPSVTGSTNLINNNERAAYVVEQTIMGGVPTDWQQEALRTANVQNLQLAVSGGRKDVKYYISGGYQKDQGMMHHSEYDKFNLRTKLDAQLSDRVKLTFNLNPSYNKRERPSTGFIDFVRFYSFLPVYHTEASAAFVNQVPQWAGVKPGDFAQARHFNGRVYSGMMPDGTMWNTTSASDPFSTANNTPKSILEGRTITSNDYRVLSSGDLTVNLAKGLDFKSLASVYAAYSDALDFSKRNATKDGAVSVGVYNNRLFIDLLSENTFNYSRQVKGHSFGLLAGFTAQKTRVRDEQTTGLDYPSDNITTLNTALQVDKAGTYNTKNQIGLLSYLGRLTYSYKSKYLLSASYRTDGSSYFAPGNKWGSFPSVSLGWVATQESFMEGLSWLNNLKLRASYGTTGNNRISDFAFVDMLYAANYAFGTGTGTVTSGQAPASNIMSNPDITWERTFSYNTGFDLSVLRNIVSLSVDVYQSKTDQLLLQQTSMGFAGVPQSWNNIGRLQNRGVEVELTTNNLKGKHIKWTTSANLSRNRNKILELGSEAFLLNQGERTELYRNKVGDPLIQFFGYKTDGVWLSQKEIDDAKAAGLKSNLSNLFTPGGLKLVDVNTDNVIDDKDRIITGSPYPDFTWGITNNVAYKAFDLSVLVQGVQGGQLINGDPNYNETKRINRNYNTNRWVSPMFPGDGKTPYSTVGFNWMLTDYVVEDASYYALREVIVGYTLPKKLAQAIKMGGARFYFSAQNLYFHPADSYRGINPEARYTSGPYATPLLDGYQRGSFPMPKTFLFGIDLNF